MENLILIEANPYERRVALLEGGNLVEFYVERERDRGIVGNIYKGKVVRVLPGMQAAFVEVGLERTAFLHAADIYEMPEEFEFVRSEEMEGYHAQSSRPYHGTSIQDMLRAGQDILVQVVKEPLGTKGARLTSHISLPGRYLVFMPMSTHIGVSRRIESEKEKKRLREIVSRLRPKGTGFIIRTACEGMSEEEIAKDMDYLLRLWGDILRKWESAPSPSLLYQEPDLTLRTLRDLFTRDIKKVIIESREEYERAIRFVDAYMPHLRPFVESYAGDPPLFELYGVEVQIGEALEKKVWLKSGGYIVIDQTEALTTIDVNTGKYVGRRDPEETAFRTNLEAAREIVYQLRLRNIGGIIIIDFIDMEKPRNRQEVYKVLKELLKKDRARTTILKISELGLVEMTRKRVRESLVQTLCGPCPYCEGRGFVKSKITVAMEIYRRLMREMPGTRKKKIVIYVHPEVAELFYEEFRGMMDTIERDYRKRIEIKSMNLFHIEQYEIL